MRPSLRRRPKARQGFTLIELLVVVVIIGILASIALPSFVGAQDKARNANAQANLNVVRTGVETFSADHKGNPPTLAQAIGKVDSEEDNLLNSSYLPGGRLPKSPWSAESQARPVINFEPTETMPTVELMEKKSVPMPVAGMRFSPPLDGAVADPPKLQSNFGALSYDVDENSGHYVIFVTGKRNGEAILGGGVSNGGG